MCAYAKFAVSYVLVEDFKKQLELQKLQVDMVGSQSTRIKRSSEGNKLLTRCINPTTTDF